MKWVVLAIILCVVPYTIITLKYRKAGPAFQPYEDSKQRANVLRLLDAGYQRINATAERPADPHLLIGSIRSPAPVQPAPSGIGEGLATALVEIPQLPVSFGNITAASESASMLPYPVVVTCLLDDQKHQLGGAQVFVRGESVVIVPQFEPLRGELTARTKESTVVITLPAGALKPGPYHVHLAGRDQSRQWKLAVK